jgi:hypothetical protein
MFIPVLQNPLHRSAAAGLNTTRREPVRGPLPIPRPLDQASVDDHGQNTRLRLRASQAEQTAAKRAVTILFAAVLGWLVSLVLGTATALADNFPVLTGLPVGWKFVEWVPGSSTAAVISGTAADGTHFLRIDSPSPTMLAWWSQYASSRTRAISFSAIGMSERSRRGIAVR